MSDNIIVVCCGCKRLKLSAYTWVTIDVPDSNRISHDTCPECIQRLYPEVAEEVLKKLREREQYKNSVKETLQWKEARTPLNPKEAEKEKAQAEKRDQRA